MPKKIGAQAWENRKYEQAIEWIALNDEPLQMSLDIIAEMISVTLIATLWGKNCETVADDVRLWRCENPQTTGLAIDAQRQREKWDV